MRFALVTVYTGTHADGPPGAQRGHQVCDMASAYRDVRGGVGASVYASARTTLRIVILSRSA